MDDRDERKVAAPITGARQQIEGHIIAMRDVAYTHPRTAGWRCPRVTYTCKCTIRIVTPDGAWFAWGTLPIADAQIGDTVRFTAMLEGGARDPHFAFYKRPTKATIVSRANLRAAS